MLRRRNFIKGVAATAALPSITRAAGAATAPDILFILADDLGYADLGCYGRDDIATPHIDSLARQGLLFRQAYAASSVCSPTRLALMTGRYPGRERAGVEEVISRNGSIGLTQPSFVSALKEQGYQTSLIGKWHLGDLPQFSPLKHGYDHFFGFKSGGADYFTHRNAGGELDLWSDDRPIEQHGYLTDLFGNRAATELARMSRDKRPFLLSLHFNAPHWPWESEGDELPAQSRPRTLAALRDYDGGSMATYRAMVEVMDRNIGRVLGALGSSRRAANTIVVFTSDNGGERFSKTWPLTGGKGELLEGGIRVPAIVRWPARVRGGTVSQEPTITMDWTATFLDAARAKMAPGTQLDGLSLLPLFAGGKLPERTLFWRHKAHNQAAARRGNLKYLSIGGHEYLSDLAADPQERANLKSHLPGRFAELKAAWTRWNAEMVPYPADSDSEDYHGILPDRY